MTELQREFLFYVFIYFIIKFGLYIGLYIGTLIVERIARKRWETARLFYQKKRADERQKWKVAYDLYIREQSVPKPEPLNLSQLVTNPNSFTAYSFVNSSKHKGFKNRLLNPL